MKKFLMVAVLAMAFTFGACQDSSMQAADKNMSAEEIEADKQRKLDEEERKLEEGQL